MYAYQNLFILYGSTDNIIVHITIIYVTNLISHILSNPGKRVGYEIYYSVFHRDLPLIIDRVVKFCY